MRPRMALTACLLSGLTVLALGGIGCSSASTNKSATPEVRAEAQSVQATPTEAPQLRDFATPTPVPVVSTPEPVVETPPPPEILADRTDCNAIRGTDYRSETEHQWFLANCGQRNAPTVAAALPAPRAGAGAAARGAGSAAATVGAFRWPQFARNHWCSVSDP